MNFLQKFIATSLLSILQTGFKNPKSLAKEKQLLTDIRDLINRILAQLP